MRVEQVPPCGVAPVAVAADVDAARSRLVRQHPQARHDVHFIAVTFDPWRRHPVPGTNLDRNHLTRAVGEAIDLKLAQLLQRYRLWLSSSMAGPFETWQRGRRLLAPRWRASHGYFEIPPLGQLSRNCAFRPYHHLRGQLRMDWRVQFFKQRENDSRKNGALRVAQ